MNENFAIIDKQGKTSWYVGQDEASRESLVTAMLNCARRCDMSPPPGHHPRVLELGAGSGRDRRYLEERLCAEYVGVEIVEHAASAAGVHHLAFEDAPEEWNGSFDWIYSRHVMEHTVNIDTALTALKRVLAPHGVIGAVTPHVFPDNEPAHVTKLRVEEWHAAYERHGLRPVYCPVLRYACEETHLVAIHDTWRWPPVRE